MTSKRKTKEEVRKGPKEGAKKEKKEPSEKEGIMIKKLGRSTLVEEDLQHIERRLEHKEPEHLRKEREPRLFYRKFVFRCGKCIHEFEHETTIPIIEHKVVCPKCGEEHVIRVVPVARHYELKLPERLTVVKEAKEKGK
ncbi:MAG TPA: zinc ribbon domain-containing protein [Candidatus Altiarchaeales archaeon]|nr:zinc ribbon domain-containing protein [Candidatus Altiarchaeales archaeon]